VSTTNHGPSNHEDDLGRALRDLVDDASLPGLDTHLDAVRGRTRRRRAAKKVALGATTLCVAGALGIAAVSLPHDARPEPVAPAVSPSPTSTPSPTPSTTPASLPTFPTPLTERALECQQPAPTPTGDQLPARLSIDAAALTVQNLENVDTTVTTTFTDEAQITVVGEKWPGAYVVVQDGVIVSSLLPLPETDGPLAPEPGSSVSREMSVDSFSSCDPEGLNDHSPSMLPGDYQVFALSRFQLDSWAPVGPDGTVGDAITGALYGGWLVSEPVPLTVVPEALALSPIEVRDVIGDDDSAVFEALRRAATTAAPAAVDLSFAVTSDWQVVEVVEQGETRRLVLPAKAQDLGRDRTKSDDGWAMDVHGGALFSDALTSDWPSNRLVGTYDVTLDESGERPTFALRVVDGGTPATAPPTRDGEICAAITDAVATSFAYPADLTADLQYLVDHPVPDDRSPRHDEIRARWIDSPRVWWAMQIDAASGSVKTTPVSRVMQVC